MKSFIMVLLLSFAGITHAQVYADWLADVAYRQVIDEHVCMKQVEKKDSGADPFFVCSRGGDTAIAGLGVNAAQSAMQALAKLLAVDTNAVTAEALSCSIHVQGKAVLPVLKSLQPTEARQVCLKTAAALQEKYPESQAGEVCLDEEAITNRRDRYVEEVTAGNIACEPWEY